MIKADHARRGRGSPSAGGGPLHIIWRARDGRVRRLSRDMFTFKRAQAEILDGPADGRTDERAEGAYKGPVGLNSLSSPITAGVVH